MLVKDLHSVANRGDLQIIAAKFFSIKSWCTIFITINDSSLYTRTQNQRVPTLSKYLREFLKFWDKPGHFFGCNPWESNLGRMTSGLLD